MNEYINREYFSFMFIKMKTDTLSYLKVKQLVLIEIQLQSWLGSYLLFEKKKRVKYLHKYVEF